jgi:2',3'-cyclic-nucleotide 2'-phosphodiesterase/3'-nucleotidase
MVGNAPRAGKRFSDRTGHAGVGLALTLALAAALAACERSEMAQALRASEDGRLGGLRVTERARLAPPTGAERTLTVVVTGDLKGWVSTAVLHPQAPRHTGLAHLAPLLRDLRATHPDLVLLDAGDALHGAPRAPLGPGVDGLAGQFPIVALMNALGYDALALGNDDFALGGDALARVRAASAFPWLAANVDRLGGGTAFPPYVVLERGEAGRRVRVGVLGLTTPVAALGRSPRELDGLRFTDLEAAARRWVPVLREVERVDVLIGLFHAGLDGAFLRDAALRGGLPLPGAAGRVAETVPGFDLIVSGDAQALSPQRSADEHTPYGVPVLQPGARGEALALALATLHLAGHAGRWRVVTVQRHTLAAEPEADPTALAVVAAPLGRLRAHLSAPTGVRIRAVPRRGEFHRCAGALSHAAVLRLDGGASRAASEAAPGGASNAALSLLPMGWAFEPPAREERGQPLTRAHLHRWLTHDESLVRVTLSGRQIALLLDGYVRHERHWRVPPHEVLWPGGLRAVLPEAGSELAALRRAEGDAPLHPHTAYPVWLTAFAWYGGLSRARQALLPGDAPQREAATSLREALFEALSDPAFVLPAPCVRWLER